MRIAFVVPSLGTAEGQGNANLELLRRVARAGNEVDVYTGIAPPVASTLRGVRVLKVSRLPAWQLGNQLLMLGTTAARIRRGRYDLIHADAGVFPGRADVLVVHTVTDRWLHMPRDIWREPGVRGLNNAVATRFKAGLEIRQARSARAVLANSQMTADDLVARGVLRERIRVLPFGIDSERYRPPTEEERAGARASFGFGSAEFVVLFVGAHGERKGLPLVVDAMAGGAPGARLLIAGDIRGGRWTRAASARGVQVVAPGKLSDVRRAYWASDVLMYPSRYDAFGMAVLEAMACGLPVVVSAAAGSHEIVRDAGLVLSEPSSASVGAAIERMRAGAQGRARMAVRARELAVGRNWDEAGEILLETYRELAR